MLLVHVLYGNSPFPMDVDVTGDVPLTDFPTKRTASEAQVLHVTVVTVTASMYLLVCDASRTGLSVFRVPSAKTVHVVYNSSVATDEGLAVWQSSSRAFFHVFTMSVYGALTASVMYDGFARASRQTNCVNVPVKMHSLVAGAFMYRHSAASICARPIASPVVTVDGPTK